VTVAREPGRLLVSSSSPFPSVAEGQVIAFAERGLEDLADLGVEEVEEVREGEDTRSLPGSRATVTPALPQSKKIVSPVMASSQKIAPPTKLHLSLPPPSPKLSPKSPAKKARTPNLLKKVQAVKTGLQFVNSLSPDSQAPH
jgi:hypothetical protein